MNSQEETDQGSRRAALEAAWKAAMIRGHMKLVIARMWNAQKKHNHAHER